MTTHQIDNESRHTIPRWVRRRIEVPNVAPGEIEYGGLRLVDVYALHDAHIVVYRLLGDGGPIDEQAVIAGINGALHIARADRYQYYSTELEDNGEVRARLVSDQRRDGGDDARAIAKYLCAGPPAADRRR